MMREHGPDSGLTQYDRFLFANADIKGVMRCEVFVLLRPTYDAPSTGAWVELGVALGRNERGERPLIIIAGDGAPCIFDALVNSYRVRDTDDEVVAIVRRIAEERAA